MKDPAHHRKYLQKKVIQKARQKDIKSSSKKSSTRSDKEKNKQRELQNNPNRPEYEGEKFDPHHRKPRLLKRVMFY